VATLIAEVPFKTLLIRNAVYQVEHIWQQNVFFSDDEYVSGARGTIISMWFTSNRKICAIKRLCHYIAGADSGF